MGRRLLGVLLRFLLRDLRVEVGWILGDACKRLRVAVYRFTRRYNAVKWEELAGGNDAGARHGVDSLWVVSFASTQASSQTTYTEYDFSES